jgi:hypothetical protein
MIDMYQHLHDRSNPESEKRHNKKIATPQMDAWYERDFNDDMTETDHDIPDNESEDEEENAGMEEEGNNYYSLGDELK